MKRIVQVLLALMLVYAFCRHAHSEAPALDSNVITCHRQYWEKQTGRWTYVTCVFPDEHRALFMRVPDHSTSLPSEPAVKPAQPAAVQIPDTDSDDDND